MGFDLPTESRFIIPVSDTQAYRQFGNAVVVPVVQAIADQMTPWIIGDAGMSMNESAVGASLKTVLQSDRNQDAPGKKRFASI